MEIFAIELVQWAIKSFAPAELRRPYTKNNFHIIL